MAAFDSNLSVLFIDFFKKVYKIRFYVGLSLDIFIIEFKFHNSILLFYY
jgi:hypothetical protein